MESPYYSEEQPAPVYWPPPGYAPEPMAYPAPPPGETPPPLKLTAEEMKTVFSLTEKMKRRSSIRQIADDLIGGRYSALNSLEPVARPLIRPSRSRWRERQVACWVLGRARLNLDQREFAVSTLTQVLEGRLDADPWQVVRRSLFSSVLFSMVMTQWMMPYYNSTMMWWNDFLPLLCISLPAFFLVMLAMQRLQDAQIRAQAATSLGHLAPLESLDALVAAIQRRPGNRLRANRLGLTYMPVGLGRRHVRSAAARALPFVLARITSEQYGQIPAATMVGLLAALDTCDENLAVSIVNAFALVGDSKVLSAVQRLAAGNGRAAREERVYQAAQRALPLIQTRVENARAPQTLLRASSVPATPQEQLLRPVEEQTPHDPLELLRASVAPNWKGSEAEIDLILAILRELEQRGDLRALPYVEQIAANPSTDTRVCLAAQACLPALRARAELERYSPTLPPEESSIAFLGKTTH